MNISTLEDEIHLCKKCINLKGSKKVVLKSKKIHSDFGIHPVKIDILFIAESPSTTGVYFYNLNSKSNLRYKLLDLLVNAGFLKKKSIEAFINRNYYLLDAVKCPFKDRFGNNANPPYLAIQNCRPFLMKEIVIYQPKIICTLGKTSLKSFIKRRKFTLYDYAGKIISKDDLVKNLPFSNTPIFASWFPAAMIDYERKLKTIKELSNYIK